MPDRPTMGPGSAAATWSKSSTDNPGAAEDAWFSGTSTNRTPGAPPTSPSPSTAAVTFGRNSTVVTMPTAPESTSACLSSSSLTRKISGVTTAPARHAAV